MLTPTIYVAIPSMDERDYLFRTLDCIARQQCEYPIKVFVCVNQPEAWWVEKPAVCENNRQTMEMLDSYSGLSIQCLDRSSKGKGWAEGKHGVGHARKELVQAIVSVASDDDVLISMDADTLFEADYCRSVVDNFREHSLAVGMATPYYHLKSNSEPQMRAMLRYEIYMRNYNLHLLRIGSPYAYTALGSAIACRVRACKAVGGFDTYRSGEDFYFLQKLCKHGSILRHNVSRVYPATRFSDRVPFGTGPAIYKGCQDDWTSYPMFHYSGFEMIKQAYDQIERLFEEDCENEFLCFLNTAFSSDNIWQPLRKNYKTIPLFTKAFHTKADGLRIFQFLRNRQRLLNKSDEQCLIENLSFAYSDCLADVFPGKTFSFLEASIEQLDSLRNFLLDEETKHQIQSDRNLLNKTIK